MRTLLNAIYLILLLTISGCAPKRFTLRPESTSGSFVAESETEPNTFYIVVKSKHALDETLARLKCETQPCMIGRLGEIYVVERPEVD
jgi:hypothetical protein